MPRNSCSKTCAGSSCLAASISSCVIVGFVVVGSLQDLQPPSPICPRSKHWWKNDRPFGVPRNHASPCRSASVARIVSCHAGPRSRTTPGLVDDHAVVAASSSRVDRVERPEVDRAAGDEIEPTLDAISLHDRRREDSIDVPPRIREVAVRRSEPADLPAVDRVVDRELNTEMRLPEATTAFEDVKPSGLVEDSTLPGVKRVFDWFDLDNHGWSVRIGVAPSSPEWTSGVSLVSLRTRSPRYIAAPISWIFSNGIDGTVSLSTHEGSRNRTYRS